MSESTVAVPADKVRLKAFKAMTPATQQVASEFASKISEVSSGLVMFKYKLGTRIKGIVENEGEYGSDAVTQLATYFNMPGGSTALYNLMNFSTAFEKDYVKAKTAIAMANGDHLNIGHWLQLMKIEEPKAREKLLDQVYKESISANDLEKMIRAGVGGKTKNARQGGRKPKTPSSPMVGLQQVFALSNKFVRYESVAEKAVFDILDEISADKVTDNLIDKAEKALEMLKSCSEKSGEMETRLEANIDRMKEIREKTAEKAAAEYTEDDDGSSKKKSKDAESENGKSEKKKKKKKKDKSKRPVAAE